MNEEERLDDLLNINNETIDNQKFIAKTINRALYKKLTKLVLLVCAILMGISCLYNYGTSLNEPPEPPFNYNDEDFFLEYDDGDNNELTTSSHNIYKDLVRIAFEMVSPGQTITDSSWTHLEDNISELNLQIEPIQKYYTRAIGSYNTKLIYNYPYYEENEYQELNIQSYTTRLETNETIWHYNLFKAPYNKTNTFYNTFDKELINEINDLPDSCVITAAISFNELWNTSDIIELIHQYPNSLITWAAIDSDEIYQGTHKEGQHDGLCIYPTPFSDAMIYLEEIQYPNLYLTDEDITKDGLETAYFSRLNFLLEHDAYFDVPTMINRESVEAKLKQANQMIAENGELQFIGVYGYFKKADLLEIIKRENIVYGSVQDVKLSILQK